MKAPNLEMKERQMLELLANGASTRTIAKKMGYSEGTVRVYLHNLYKKLGVKNRTEALLWQLDRSRPVAERVAMETPLRRSRADESFGDVALRDGLLCTLGVMESFTGPYGRVWEIGARLKGVEPDQESLAMRDDVRALWRALLDGSFAYAKRLHEAGFAERALESFPSATVLLASLLLLGGYSHAADACIAQLSKARKSGPAVSARELALLRALRDAINSKDDEALAAVHRLAVERSAQSAIRQLAMVALFHAFVQRKDSARAGETANVIWSEAAAARRELEAMGVRPLAREATVPKPGKAPARAGTRERAAAGS